MGRRRSLRFVAWLLTLVAGIGIGTAIGQQSPPADSKGVDAQVVSTVDLAPDMSGYQFGVTDGRWKEILPVADGIERLYDLAADPREQHDLSRTDRDRAASMRGRVSAFVDAEERYLHGERGARIP